MKTPPAFDSAPLLRPPPFPELSYERKSRPAPSVAHKKIDQTALFAAIRETRVGGAFWGKPWRPDETRDGDAPETIVRSFERLQEDHGADGPRTIHLVPNFPHQSVDPWSVLPKAHRVIAQGDDEWIAFACILGLEVEVLCPGRFGMPGDSLQTLSQRAFDALTEPFPDPFGDGYLTPMQAISLLADWRRVIDRNRGLKGERIVAAAGMSWWKRKEIRRFLWSPGSPLRICFSAERAVNAASQEGGALAVWPSRISSDLEQKAQRKGVKIVRVEDGFVRSVGLGSNLVPPLSVIVDRQGIHYDPTSPSDLETMLANTQFTRETRERAAKLRSQIVASRISKYAAGSDVQKPLSADRGPADPIPAKLPPTKRIVLVPGQVEDDMSVLTGGAGLTSNLELLRRTRALEPHAEIWWRPHPDVDAGHRTGAVDDTAALQYADRIVREGAMSDLLDRVDALHTITSLSGFEALLRGCEVTCHGVPFYCGWGLTRDLGNVPTRRGRSLSLDELVAGVLLLYPRYLDPVTGLPCPPETLVQRLIAGEVTNRLSWIEPLRRIQGRFMRRWRSDGNR